MLFLVYLALAVSEVALVPLLFMAGAYTFLVPKAEEKWITEIHKCYKKASYSILGQKLPLPLWETLKTRSLVFLSFLVDKDKVPGGVVHVISVYGCPCQSEDQAFLKPYRLEDENDASESNIFGYLDHKREPRSNPQVRRLLIPLGVKDDKELWQREKEIYNKLVLGNKKHKRWSSRLRRQQVPALTSETGI